MDRRARVRQLVKEVEAKRPERDVGLLAQVHRGAVAIENTDVAQWVLSHVLVSPREGLLLVTHLELDCCRGSAWRCSGGDVPQDLLSTTSATGSFEHSRVA